MALRDLIESLRRQQSGSKGARRLALVIGVGVFSALFYVLIAGNTIDALRNFVWFMEELGSFTSKAATWSPVTRISMIVAIALTVWIVLIVLQRWVPKSNLRNAMVSVVLVCSLLTVSFFVSMAPRSDAIPTTARIAVAVYTPASGGPFRAAQVQDAARQARAAIEEFGRTDGYPGVDALRQVPLDVRIIELRNSATATQQILQELQARPFSYLVLAAPQDAVDYSNLIKALQQEVLTFLVRPVDSRGSEAASITIYPAPEVEAEWMAEFLLKNGARRIAVFQPKNPSDYERRCAARFARILERAGLQEPYRRYNYGTSAEAREDMQRLLQDRDPPEAIYIVDTGANVRELVITSAQRGFRGHLALTSFALDYIDPRDSYPGKLKVTVPWPMEHYLARVKSKGNPIRYSAEKETITGANLYSAVVLADHVHHTAQTLKKTDIEKSLYALSHHVGDHYLLPIGSMSLSKKALPPTSEIAVKVLGLN